ncbi:MAG: YlbF family regulator [Clostridia bacterium]|nr:YlbF family regulator [Clostridia bacterium]
MSEVFVKTRELAEALMRSEEYLTMKAAEDIAIKNEEAAAIMAQYMERQQELEAIMMKGEPDVEGMNRLSGEMERLQKQLQETPDIANLTKARNNFSNLINQVNQVLRFTITGEMGDEAEDCSDAGTAGCTGSCATCRGCH